MAIDYDHSHNLHYLPGPRTAFPLIFAGGKPQSLLDVGCGIGIWLKVALENGVMDISGVDGVDIKPNQLLIPPSAFRQQDLTQIWNLGRRFDAAFCLEVAEHLDERYASRLIDCLVAHSDHIIFGAACPGQTGQHHVNCQWPAYWQQLFNERGYVCSDEIRWKMWSNEQIEPWYRQNIFVARRDPPAAGKEPRIVPVLHPAIVKLMLREEFPRNLETIGQGELPFAWYWQTMRNVFWKKLKGKFN
ncbi:MAG: class I SAM-dependent methyltransferase [Verrucomicrobiota bacterium]